MATLGTFMVSALWHGIYPMYFFCFFYIFVLCELSKDFYKAGDKIAKVIPFKPLRNALAWFAMMLNCCFFCLMWRLREPATVMIFVNYTYAIPVFLSFGALFLSRITGFAKISKKE